MACRFTWLGVNPEVVFRMFENNDLRSLNLQRSKHGVGGLIDVTLMVDTHFINLNLRMEIYDLLNLLLLGKKVSLN